MLSKNISYIPRLDHLRFLAASMIFAFHIFHDFFGNWKPHPQLAGFGLITEGHTGIALFFVLSGFMFMTISYKGGNIQYGKFMHNRFLRIFPLFLFIFFLSISVGRDQFRAADVIYIFFSNLGTAPTSSTFITGAAWTISLEFTFYMVFPFLAKFTRNQGPGYLIRLPV
ncbi:acyltransferase family protein [Desulfobacter curvatus]|uniref:acyltransferase family protein n=1 Tax=Desulfobacter curvatus TaxID=2290 RepID=UPI0003692E2B